MWLAAGVFLQENRQLLLSDKITFVSVYQHVKIQFAANKIESALLENNDAFYMDLPARDRAAVRGA